MADTAQREHKARDDYRYLTTKQAAYQLGLTVSGLAKMRQAGKGPVCRRHGRTWRYRIDDLEAWSEARRGGGDD